MTGTAMHDDDRNGDVLVFQHLAAETPGLVGRHLASAGLELRVVEFDNGDPIPDLEGFDALIVMGGPMDVWEEDVHPWLVAEKVAIRHWVEELERPYLGVCLGHQLLAASLGGEVVPMKTPEIGVMQILLTDEGATDPLLGALPSTFPGLQWHHAAVVAVPPDSVVLAGNSHCSIQAFRTGSAAWGVQFHIEASAPEVALWGDIPEYRATLAASGNGDPSWMYRAVQAKAAAMESACAALSDELLGQIRVHRSVGRGPSR
jgi:GMP synthase-like glutamine amidotransferase